jgi:preprotein translocase subunit SecD
MVVVLAFGWLLLAVAAGWSPQLGLDLDGGLSVVYKPAHHATQDQLNETVNILTNRVDGLGVSGAKVGTQGGDVVVSIPGVKNPNAVLKAIGTTGQLYFRGALCGAPAFVGTGAKGAKPAGSTLPACSSTSQLTATNLNVQANSSAAAGFTSSNPAPDQSLAPYPNSPDNPVKTVLLPTLHSQSLGYDRMVLGPAGLTGHSVKSASAQLNSTGQWVVNYTLTPTGSTAWDTFAKQNFHQMVAIDLDGQIYSAPIIQPTQSSFTSFAGQGQISGQFTQAQAEQLAQAMEYGSLPVKLVAQQSQTVSPTLGKASLKAGLLAGLIGLLLVLIYVIIYYRALGLVVVAGLVVTSALLYAIIATLGHTQGLSLDLAGVTGIIVSIGITVDSYIVYFERLKDETRSGRTVRTSVDRGFQSAWRTVLAADLVSFIGAAALWIISIGEVKGFAFFLGLSTLLDVFVTYFFTRPVVILLGTNERVSEAKTMGIARGLGQAAAA